jgi:hypothetical protein
LSIKLRAGLLGLMAVLLLGSISVPSALAGPYFLTRTAGSKGNGVKIAESAPEAVTGKGGTQRLSGEIGGKAVTLESSEVNIGGKIYNNVDSGVAELELKYAEPKVVGLSTCKAKIGTNNTVSLIILLVWKWNKTKTQLEEPNQSKQFWDGLAIHRIPVLSAKQETEQEIELPKEEFTKISFSAVNCGVLAGSFAVNGSDGLVPIPQTPLNTFVTSQEFASAPGGVLFDQHWWKYTRRAYLGFTVALTFGGNPAKYEGDNTLNAPAGQELAVSEI